MQEDVTSHYSTDRFCGNQMGFQGMSQPIVQYTAPFILQVRIHIIRRVRRKKKYTCVVGFDITT